MAVTRLPAFLFFALFLTCLSYAQTPVTFLQPESLGSCSSLAAADFNGDGNLDVACSGSTTITIWLGDGHGHFQRTPQTLPATHAVMVAGDFNRDGHPDLVVAGTALGQTNQMVLLPGHGDGSFGARIVILDLPSAFTALAAADFNHDGRLDLAAAVLANTGVAQLQVFLGHGDGTFQNPVATGASPLNFSTISIADINRDGIPDIVSLADIDFGYVIQVTLGHGDGTFGSPIDTPTPTGPAIPSFAVADFTGDQVPDLAITSFAPSTGIYILKGNGDGTFSPGGGSLVQAGSIVVAVDLNGDGRPDLVMDGGGIALNGGGGNFPSSTWYQNQSGQGGVAGDFRHLGRPDLVIAGDFYANNGDGTFHAPRSFPTGCGFCWTLTPGDFNRDGRLDTAAVSGGAVRVYAGNGTGSFTGFRQSTYVVGNDQTTGPVAAADFNSDGKLDLALGIGDYSYPRNVGGAAILPGNGDGSFGALQMIYTGYPVYAVVPADFNRDGLMDLALGTNHGVIVMVGKGTGAFQTIAAFKDIYNSTSLVVADFNRDGIPDFATASDVYLGNGDGTFHHAANLPGTGQQVVAGDFNGDGIPDLVTTDLWSIYFWPGVGDGTFGLPLTVAPAPQSLSLAVSDLNGDGIADLIVSSDAASALTLYLGPNFTPQTVTNLPQTNGFPMIGADFNHDGRTDLLFIDAMGQLMVLLNTTTQP
jgi:hypothetical protein